MTATDLMKLSPARGRTRFRRPKMNLTAEAQWTRRRACQSSAPPRPPRLCG